MFWFIDDMIKNKVEEVKKEQINSYYDSSIFFKKQQSWVTKVSYNEESWELVISEFFLWFVEDDSIFWTVIDDAVEDLTLWKIDTMVYLNFAEELGKKYPNKQIILDEQINLTK